MSGHSKWHQIRRQKGVNDSKRGQLFTRLGREIVVAVREGGGPDPDANFRLRMAIERARAANMPLDNIDRTIKRASGSSDGANLEEITYEGYAPGGAAIMVQVMTDNRNRAAADIRNCFNKNAGNLGEVGCVDWIFEPRGIIGIAIDNTDPDEMALEVIDAGAEDVIPEGDMFEIRADAADFMAVREGLEKAGIKYSSAELTMIPKNTVALDESDARKTLRLLDALEDNDDVQEVYANFDIPDEVMEALAG